MKLALDANRYCDLCRGIAEVVEATSQAERVYLPLILLTRDAHFKHLPQLSQL
ncbi:MAG: hypothetical protein ABSH34_21595 [Verrucomicrobiota bacterium]|jgi:hypothetical protein